MLTLFYFAVTIIVIVAIHEWGHYIAMRAFGVRVLTFSIGFGPSLLKWKNKHDTVFTLAALPLGGYVKPLDRRDCDVADDQLDEEFSGKPPWQRIITYAAGPLANLVLAFLLYWLVFLGGETVRAPVAGEPIAASVAAQAGVQVGDQWLQVNGLPVDSWNDVLEVMLDKIGEQDVLPVLVVNQNQQRELQLPISALLSDPDQDPLTNLGIVRSFLPKVGEVVPDSPADRAGLKAEDLVIGADQQEIDTWQQWVALVQASPEREMELMVMRGDVIERLSLVPEAVEMNGELVGRAGVMLAVGKHIDYSVAEAMLQAGVKLQDQTMLLLNLFGKLVTGKLSFFDTLGGPVTIAKTAEQTASYGVITFTLFLASLSVMLGVVNLFPIPVLDGGWIVFGFMEMLIRRPLSEKFIMASQSVGMVFIFGLMFMAIYSDLIRHF